MPVPAPHADLLAAADIRQHDVELWGSRTRYWEYGPADADVTLVAVHGYRGEHHGLEPVVVRLDGIRVVSPDLPGFGQSTPMTERPHSIAGYGAWLRALLDRLGLTGTAVLLGHSFGSIVVAHAVADGLPAPSVILVNPIARDAASASGVGATRFFYGVGRRLPERWARAWLSNPLVVRGMSVTLAQTLDPALRRWIHEQHRRYFSRFATRDSVVEGFDASLSTHVLAVADRITPPVLLIAGERDLIAPLDGQFELLDALPDARLDVIPGVGHLVHYETPVVAAAAIRTFLADQAGSAAASAG